MRMAKRLCGLLIFVPAGLVAEVESEIPLGIEGVTGIRSDYVHRGFQLADSALSFQLEGKRVFSKTTSLNFGLAHFTENGGGFYETTGYLRASRRFGDALTLGSSLTYRDRNESRLDGGFDLGLFTSFDWHEDWCWRNELNFDLGVDGIYAASQLEWSTAINDDSFLTIRGGLSLVSDYLDRDGLNDFHTRLSYTYALSDQVSFTPFVGASVQLSDTEDEDILFGGLWFEVIF